MIEVKQGKVIVTKNNTTEVYTLKEYTDTIYYRKLYTRIYQIICIILAMFIPAIFINLFK
tara:strand:- start:1727 stop:1906 length:180 start_codon:yes stop_codon:yes gene_type:complete